VVPGVTSRSAVRRPPSHLAVGVPALSAAVPGAVVVGRACGAGIARPLGRQEPPEDLGDTGPADAQVTGEGRPAGELPRVEEALIETGQGERIAPRRG